MGFASKTGCSENGFISGPPLPLKNIKITVTESGTYIESSAYNPNNPASEQRVKVATVELE